MPIKFKFDLKRTAQATGVLMRADDVDRMNYMRLLKLLYLTDRESIRRTGRPVTGDRAVAMPRGPVLSRAYDLIMDRNPLATEWRRFFRTVHYDLKMHADPGVGQLSRSEIDLLKKIAKEHRDRDEWDMVDYTHKYLPEFQKHDPGDRQTSVPIPVEDIVEAVGRSGDIESIAQDAHDSLIYDRIFGR